MKLRKLTKSELERAEARIWAIGYITDWLNSHRIKTWLTHEYERRGTEQLVKDLHEEAIAIFKKASLDPKRSLIRTE